MKIPYNVDDHLKLDVQPVAEVVVVVVQRGSVVVGRYVSITPPIIGPKKSPAPHPIK